MNAQAERNIQAHAADGGGAGTVAAGVTVMAVVVGGKLDQDSADQLTRIKLDADTGKKTVGNFDPQGFSDAVFGSNSHLAGYSMNTLAQMLAGDGQRFSDIQLGTNETDQDGNVTGQSFDASAGYVSGDFLDEDFDDQGSTGRGEGHVIDSESNKDLAEAENILSNPLTEASKNLVSAIVGSGVKMTAKNHLTVKADELLQAELCNATITGAGTVGVAVGLSTAVLFSNVVAGVDDGAELNAGGTIHVEALSRSVPYETPDTSTSEGLQESLEIQARNKFLAENLEGPKTDGNSDPTDLEKLVQNRTIRVISFVGTGAGIAGVGVVGTAISLNNITQAYMNGDVTGARELRVTAANDYPYTLAATGSIGGAGIAGITASFAVAVSLAEVSASIGGDAHIRGVTDTILVKTDSDFDTVSAGAAIAGALVGVNAGVVVHVNRMKVHTFIGKNVTMDCTADLTVEAINNTTANTYFAGVAGGLVGVGVSPAIVVTKPVIYTYIGVNPETDATSSGTIKVGAATVRSDVESTANPLVINGSGGGVSVSGTLLLVFNKVRAITGVLRKAMDVTDALTVSAEITAIGEADFASGSAGGVAVGIPIAYVQVDSHNEALIDLTGLGENAMKAGSVTITANGVTKAVSTGISASLGAGAVNAGTSTADNRSRSNARLIGTSGDKLTASGKVSVDALGTALAHAKIVSITAGGMAMSITPVVAVLRNVQNAMVENLHLDIGSIQVTSKLNENLPVSSLAELDSASLAMAGLTPNIAVAYGRSSVLATLKPGALTANGNVEVAVSGNAGTRAHIFSAGEAVFSGNLAAGFAYAQAGFLSELYIPKGQTVAAGNGGKVSVTAEDICIFADSDVTPNALGNLSILALKVNLAIAMTKGNVKARLLGGGTLNAAGNVSVTADSDSYTKATLHSPILSIGFAQLGANVAVAWEKTSQIAAIGDSENSVKVISGGTVDVSAKLNEAGPGEIPIAYGALATTEGSSEYRIKGDEGNWVNLSYFEAAANVMVAKTAATNIAEIWGSLESDGLNVDTASQSRAYAQPGTDMASVSLAGIGVNVVIADAGGTFQALIHTPAAGTITVGSDGITILNTYKAEATARGGQPSFGFTFDLALLDAEANVAQAETSVNASVGILGAAQVTTTGAINITAEGEAKASADITGTQIDTSIEINGIQIAVNVVDATVGGIQVASIQAGTIYADGGINVYSNFNNHGTGHAGYDANATVGSNSGEKVEISFLDITTSTADAAVTAQVYALISGATIGDAARPARAIRVYTQAQSLAKADVNTGDTANYVNVTVLTTTANAAGIFRALVGFGLDGEGEVSEDQAGIYAASVDVQVISRVKSTAVTGTSGSVSTSLVEVDYNEAESETTNISEVRAGGSGSISGSFTLKTTAAAEASASTVHPKITLGGFNVAANKTSSKLNATANALLDNIGTLRVGGLVSVSAVLDSKSQADVGGIALGENDGKQVQIAGLLAGGHEVRATSQGTVTAGITSSNGKGALMASVINVDAIGNSRTEATTSRGFSLSVLNFGDMDAQSYSRDTIHAYVEKTSIEAGGLSVNARGDTTATASVSVGTSVSAVQISTNNAQAGIGAQSGSDTYYQSVKAGIGDDADIVLTGNLSVLAYNKGKAEAQVAAGTRVTVAGGVGTSIPTVSYYNTEAYVGDNSSIRAGGNVSVRTEDDTGAVSKANSSFFSFTISAEDAKGENEINAYNQVQIGASSIFAAQDVLIKAFSKADMEAETINDNAGGFVNVAVMTASNKLIRLTAVEILDGASIESDFGDIEILAQSGTKDEIRTNARTEGEFSAAGFDHADADTTITSYATVDIGRVRIFNPFGTVHIWSDSSLDGYNTNAHSSAKGIGAEPDARNDNVISLYSTVTIDGGSAGGADLTARNLEIHSRTTEMKITGKSDAVGKALGLNVDANTQMDVFIDTYTYVQNAILRGYDKVYLTSSSSPDYDSQNIYSYAKMHLGGVGEGVAEAALDIYHDYGSRIQSGVTIYSADAKIKSYAYDGGYKVHKNTSGAFAQYQKGEAKLHTDSSDGSRVDGSTTFYIGDAAAGICIDVYEKNGSPQVRQVGIKDEKRIWTISNNKILFQAISNSKPGYLTMDVSGTFSRIFDQKFIPHVTITNRTSLDLEFGNITVENSGYIDPRVELKGGSYSVRNVAHNPLVTVTSWGEGDVDVKGLISNPRGQVEFYWIGETGGNLLGVENIQNTSSGTQVAPLWANGLVVEGANNIGTADKDFNVWLTKPEQNAVRMRLRSTIADLITPVINAEGDVYLKLTPVAYQVIDELLWEEYRKGNSFPATGPLVEISQITAGGQLHIVLEQSTRVFQKENTNTVAMPVPGTLEYITGKTVQLGEDVTIPDLTVLFHYLESYDLATGVSIYLLPNGAQVYTDRYGEIFRIQENGIDFSLEDYQYNAENNTVSLGQGVLFNLNTGALSIEEGYSYEALLSSLSGNWIMSRYRDNEYRFLFVEPGKTFDKDASGNLIIPEGENVNLEALMLDYWYTDGDIDYYYLTDPNNPSAPTPYQLTYGKVGQVYILAVNVPADTIQAYLMENETPPATSESIFEYYQPYDMSDDYYSDSDMVTMTIWMPDGSSLDYYYRTLGGVVCPMADWNVTSRDGNTATTQLLAPKWNKTTVTYSDFMGTGFAVAYDLLSGKYYIDGTELSGIAFNWIGDCYVSQSASGTGKVQQFYDKARELKVHWNMYVNNEQGFYLNDYNFCYWNGSYNKVEGQDYSLRGYGYGRDLQAKYTTYSYATMRPIDLVIAPKTAAGDHTHEIMFLDSGGSGGNVTIAGQVENIQIKSTSLPTNSMGIRSDEAYRITSSLYILKTSDRNKNGMAVLLNDASFTATYNSTTGKYDSDSMTATNLTRKPEDVIYMPTVTLKSGQKVWLEAVSNSPDGKTSIAKDIQGRYWIHTGSDWSVIDTDDVAATIRPGQNGVDIDKGQGTKLDDLTVKTTDVNGRITIQENQTQVQVIAETGDGILTKRTVDGVDEYYLFSAGIWTHIQPEDARELSTIQLITDTLAVRDGIYYRKTGNVWARAHNDAATVQVIKEVDGVLLTVSGDVYYTVHPDGTVAAVNKADLMNLYGWDLTPTEQTMTLPPNGKTVEIPVSSTTLTMTASIYITLEGNTDSQDMTIGSDGSVEMGAGAESEITQVSKPVDGTEYRIGHVTGESVIVEFTDPTASLLDNNGSDTNITATGGDVTFVTSYEEAPSGTVGTQTDPLEIIVTDGKVNFINRTVKGDEDKLIMDTYLNVDGSFGLNDDIIIDGMGEKGDTSLVITTSESDIGIGRLQVMRNGYVNLSAGGNITVAGDLAVDESQVFLSAGKDMRLKTVSAEDSTLLAAAGQNLIFDIVEARESNLTMGAGSSLNASGSAGYIRFRDTDGTDNAFTLAGGNIGTAAQPLMVDTDDILFLPTVQDYYLESVELAGDAFYTGKRPDPDLQASGLDKDGKLQSGDLLQDIGNGTYYGKLAQQLNGEIASLIVARKDRQTAADLLTEEALALLMEKGSITAQTLQQLLVSDAGVQLLSVQKIQELLAQGNEILNGLSGYAVLAQTLKPQLTAQAVTDEAIISYLTLAMDEGKVDLAQVETILEAAVTDAEIQDMIHRAWQTIDYDLWAGSGYTDAQPRPIEIRAGTASGAAYVTNDGDILIRQDQGTLTVGSIRSDRGDVILISGEDIQGNGGGTDITGSSINLIAAGGAGDSVQLTIDQMQNLPVILAERILPMDRQEVTITRVPEWALETLYQLRWVRVEYAGNATVLNVTAGGDVDIAEISGDLGLGTVQAGGTIHLTADGSILDKRTAGVNTPNLQASAGVLTAENGSIGTTSRRLDVQVPTLTATSKLDISLNALGSMDLTADTAEGYLYADGTADLTIRNRSGDLRLGAVEAAKDLSVTSRGGFLLGDTLGREAQLKGRNISILAENGNAGTEAKTLTIDTTGGVLNTHVTGGMTHITEVSGNLTVGSVNNPGPEGVKLVTLDGSILDNSKDLIQQAADKQIQAIQAQAQADALADQLAVMDDYTAILADLQTLLQEAKAAVNQAQKDLEALENDPAASIRALNMQREVLRKAQEDAQKALENAKTATNGALDQASDVDAALAGLTQEAERHGLDRSQLADDLAKARQEARDAQAQAQQAKQNAAASGIRSGGDVTLEMHHSNGTASAGQDGNALGVTSGGTVTVTTGDSTKLENVFLESGADIHVAPLEAGNTVSITAAGDVTGTEITAPAVRLNSLEGDIGAESVPMELHTDTLQASGENIYIVNDRGLTLDAASQGTVDVRTDGDLSGSILGKDAAVQAGGDITLSGEMDQINAQGENVTISSQGDVTADQILAAETVTIHSGGQVTDQGETDAIISQDLTIDAGAAGKKDNPLNVSVSGQVNVTTVYGIEYLTNGFSGEAADRVSCGSDTGSQYSVDSRTLVHAPTGIRVTGRICADACLVVLDACEHDNCSVCAYLMTLEAARLLSRWQIRIQGAYEGTLLVQIPVDAAWEGRIVTVAFCDNGLLAVRNLQVKDGCVSFQTQKLHTYYLLNGAYTVENGAGLVLNAAQG